MYIHMRSSSGLFHVHINAKSVNQFRAGKRKLTPPSFGKECKRQCHEDAAVKNSEYDQEIPQSQTADYPVAPRGRAAQPSRDTRKTN